MRLDAASQRRACDLRRATFMAHAACPTREYIPGYAGSIRPQARNIPPLDGATAPVAYHPNGKGCRVAAPSAYSALSSALSSQLQLLTMRTEPNLAKPRASGSLA